MRYLEDGQVKNLSDRNALEEALKFYEDNDRWYFPYASEIHVKGVDDAPLLYGDYKDSIKGTCPEKAFEENVGESGLFFSMPDTIKGAGINTFAIREIGLLSAYERAGLACRLIRTLQDTGCIKALGAEKRGELLDLGFHQSEEPVKVLVSDEKISTIGSSRYAIMDYREGIQMTEQKMKEQDDFDELNFVSAEISHDGLIVRYELTGMGPDGHKAQMKQMGVDVEKYLLIWSSSHVKASSMIGRICLVVNGIHIPVGRATKVRHLGEASKLLENFGYGISKMGAALKENEDQVEKLGNMTILYPKKCLERAFEACSSIPTSAKKQVLDSFSDVACTGIDIFLAVSQAAMLATGVREMINAMEEAAQVQFMNLKAFDKD